MSAPDPEELAQQLQRSADAATLRPIDIDAMLAASRSRRRARRTAIVGATGAVATVLAVGGLVFALQPLGGGVTTAGAPASQQSLESADAPAQEAAGGAASDIRLAPPEKVNACGSEPAPPTNASDSGLVVTVEPLGPAASGAGGEVRVTVTNAGGSDIAGEVRTIPSMAVASAGVVRWHTNGAVADDLQPIDLAPGDSVDLAGHVQASACSEADEALEAFPDDLPALQPGMYEVSAVVMFVDRVTGDIQYLVAPGAPLVVE